MKFIRIPRELIIEEKKALISLYTKMHNCHQKNISLDDVQTKWIKTRLEGLSLLQKTIFPSQDSLFFVPCRQRLQHYF
jgi:hypothetical protein